MNPNESKNSGGQTIIYFDGGCPMCTALVDKVDSSPQKAGFDLKDITTGSLPEGVTKEQVEKEIHVIAPDGKLYRNSEAIIKIMEGYPGLSFLTKVAKLPLIRNILPLGYKLVAINRHFIFGDSSRIFWLKNVVSLGLISGLLLSCKLWMSTRFFPRVPVLEGYVLPQGIETFLYFVLLSFLILIIFFPKPKKLIFSVLAISLVYAFFDQMRWQPWFYQYFFMFATLSFFSWDYLDKSNNQKIINTNRLIVSSIYFFSGLQKVNMLFVSSTFPTLITPFINFLPVSIQNIAISTGAFVPFVEMAIAIGFLTKKYRKYSAYTALLMHVFLLVLLGPIGLNWNSVVWPWNVTMMLLVLILFWRVEDYSYKDVLFVKKFFIHKVVFLLFVIMPFFSFFNLWDSYLSSTLYSGNTNSANIYINDRMKMRLPTEIQDHVIVDSEEKLQLDFFMWSFNDLNVPTYPESRIYKSIIKGICDFDKENKNLTLVINGKPSLFNGGERRVYGCGEL